MGWILSIGADSFEIQYAMERRASGF